MRRFKKRREFYRIEFAVGSDTAAEIEPKRFHRFNCLAHIFGFEPPGEIHGHASVFDNFPAELPVMRASCAAEFFNGEVGISTVKQQRVDIRGYPQRFVDIFCADNMNYLHDFDGRRCRADFSVGIVRDRVDQLYN